MALCAKRGCDRVALQYFCQHHLEKPEVDQYQFTTAISVNPTRFKVLKIETEFQRKNMMASALHLTSPLNLKQKRVFHTRTQRSILESLKHNEKFLKVRYLKPYDFPEKCCYAQSEEIAMN